MSQHADALIDQIERTWNTIRGRFFGLIESWGLPDAQEAGAKSTFRALAGDAQARLTALVDDGALARALTAVTEGLAELERFKRDIEASGDLPAIADRLEQHMSELREHQRDLRRLQRINAELERPR